ncbi:UTP--glucose-1-phosphate uridylyltransferase [Arsenicicoccus dermatophilus]|uniref:UTP--glucose-1-phosphate uridylyltransferase n=1 Tax=Arsenicicoccus dermatophilus TaxID=1076331 RepID=UPI00391713C1
MSQDGLARAQQVMTDAGVNATAIQVFSHYYGELEEGATGVIREDSIRPLTEPPSLEGMQVTDEQAREALSRTVVIKLNGGLGTSMGMTRAKSLLPVRDGKSFLDIVVQQVLAARQRYDVRLPLLLMDSFNTREDTLAALAAYPELAVEDLPLDFLQSQEPKLRTDDLTPVRWPADPKLEWCPPGHGDLYPSLLSSGILESLLDKGFRYATVSNGDNLGAAPDARLAGWFAASGAPYAAEVCRRTAMDRKGGHLAIRVDDGQLILRETAQTAPEEMDHFTDEHRHAYFHTNNLWLDLERLHALLVERDGVLGLPLIRNVKTVDPKDPSSPEVYQIESAMGAAVAVFQGAQAVEVPRSRFLPVKTTNELMLLRSDVYELREDGTLHLLVDKAPVVCLDGHFAKIADFEQRVPGDVPSLREATRLAVAGDWTFGDRVVVKGEVSLADEGEPRRVEDGTVLQG